MAKTLELNKKAKYPYPSRFGSHGCMINIDLTNELNLDPHNIVNVILTDEFGNYKTSKDRLDNGLADPNRCASSRLGKLYEKTEKKKD